MDRRILVLSLLVAVGGLAGCVGPPATGSVVQNGTALTVVDHEASVRTSAEGTRLRITVTVRNAGETPLGPQASPRITCRFLAANGTELYAAGRTLVDPLSPDARRTLTFGLSSRSAAVARYELAVSAAAAGQRRSDATTPSSRSSTVTRPSSARSSTRPRSHSRPYSPSGA